MKERQHCRMQRHGSFLITLLLLIFPCTAHSEIITQEMGKGLVATAKYLQGDAGLPAILIMHGFLQTRDFITVRRLADSLHDNGYTLLLPNLSLGINIRQESLSCEAIHTHSMEQDLKEISRWVDWLTQRTDRNIVLIGHSAGSLELTAYLSRQLNPPVAHSIFLSLIAYGMGPVANESPVEMAKAREDLQTSPGSLGLYGLAYCRHYLTTPARYLSYAEWDKTATLAAISRIHTPVTVILGGNDQRISSDWADSLKHLDLDIIEIEGANHFFDYQYEFDLLEAIEAVLDHLAD